MYFFFLKPKKKTWHNCQWRSGMPTGESPFSDKDSPHFDFSLHRPDEPRWSLKTRMFSSFLWTFKCIFDRLLQLQHCNCVHWWLKFEVVSQSWQAVAKTRTRCDSSVGFSHVTWFVAGLTKCMLRIVWKMVQLLTSPSSVSCSWHCVKCHRFSKIMLQD